jgi:ADP-ribose pyrophosphatase
VQAGSRELLEETGFAGKNARVIGEVSPNPAIQNNCCYTVLIEDVEQVAEQNMDEMEDIEVSVVPLDVVDDLAAEGRINHGLVLNALMFFAQDQGMRENIPQVSK